MAEALKHHFGAAIALRLAADIAAVLPSFDRAAFVAEAQAGFDALELLPRGWHLAHALRRHLPAEYPRALAVLLDSLGPPLDGAGSLGMAPFYYLPHVFFVAAYGLDDFEPSMRAQHALTQRFSAEFSIRPFLERHREATLARLHEWTRDQSPHVRRLVSEGTRPRLPWAPRLRDFQRDPSPVLALLEALKDDESLYVRRSVANNLNDIGKDHPELLFATVERWRAGADGNRQWLLRHALRSAVKRGEAGALGALGFAEAPAVELLTREIEPATPRIGGRVRLGATLRNTSPLAQRWLVDLRVHYVKADGLARPKVFKITTLELPPGATVALGKTLSLAQMSTRRHYPGRHLVELAINGALLPLGGFELRP